jgi:hypothetical protein
VLPAPGALLSGVIAVAIWGGGVPASSRAADWVRVTRSSSWPLQADNAQRVNAQTGPSACARNGMAVKAFRKRLRGNFRNEAHARMNPDVIDEPTSNNW